MLKINTSKLHAGTSENVLIIRENACKINLKIHKADLQFVDAIADKFKTSRSNILVDILKKGIIEKINSISTEFDSKILIAKTADSLSTQNIVEGYNDLGESWIYEVVRDSLKSAIEHQYIYSKLSEQDVENPIIKDEIEDLRHSEEHNKILKLIKERV